MVKHTQTIRWQKLTNCLRVFDHFVGFRRYKIGILARNRLMKNMAAALEKTRSY